MHKAHLEFCDLWNGLLSALQAFELKGMTLTHLNDQVSVRVNTSTTTSTSSITRDSSDTSPSSLSLLLTPTALGYIPLEQLVEV